MSSIHRVKSLQETIVTQTMLVDNPRVPWGSRSADQKAKVEGIRDNVLRDMVRGIPPRMVTNERCNQGDPCSGNLDTLQGVVRTLLNNPEMEERGGASFRTQMIEQRHFQVPREPLFNPLKRDLNWRFRNHCLGHVPPEQRADMQTRMNSLLDQLNQPETLDDMGSFFNGVRSLMDECMSQDPISNRSALTFLLPILAYYGYWHNLSLLLQISKETRGILDLDFPDPGGATILHRAVEELGRRESDSNALLLDISWEEVIRDLIAAEANPNIQNLWANTVLHIAVRYNATQIVSHLLAAGGDPNIQNNYGETPLHVAIFNKAPRSALRLLAAGADPNIQNCEGKTSLHIARRRLPRIIPKLLASGADPKIKNHQGYLYDGSKPDKKQG